MSLAKNMKMYRYKIGLSQKKLAERVNLKQTTISAIENGRSVSSIPTLKKIAKLFGCTVDELIKEE